VPGGGTIQRVNARSPQLRTELLENARQSQDLGLHVRMELVELRFKLIADLYDSAHSAPSTLQICYAIHMMSSP
jgi:hypothetical protein